MKVPATIALLTVCLLAACTAKESKAPATTPPPTTTATTTTEPADTTYTLAELVDEPCLVLNEDDSAAVGSFIEQPTEFAGGKQCLWITAAGGVTFIPHPTADLTADPASQQDMTVTEVSGHRALLGVLIKDRGCAMYVAYGSGGSFELGESRDSQNPPEPGTCPLSPKFAAAIIANLR